MKKIFLTGMAFCCIMTACTKLDVDVESELSTSNFPTTQEGFVAASGPAYTQLARDFAVTYWRMQELSTDEAIIPARGGNYNDGGQYRFMHLHTWTKDHPYMGSIWSWGYGGVNKCNMILDLFERAPETRSKEIAIAEIKTMRAFFHFLMMDLYGNVPVITEFGAKEQPKQLKRAEVFAFIEKELKENLPDLEDVATTKTYARPTKSMVFALLAKMYLNASVYAGKTMNTEAVAMADSVLNRAYSLDASYMSVFAPDNGPATRETIFAVPYDPNYIEGNHFTRFGLHTSVQNKYAIPFRPSIAMSTIKEFWEKFNLPNDARNSTWLAGKQYENDGSPIIIATTKKGLDASYAGADGTAKINWQLEFIPELSLEDVPNMDIGNDELAKAQGVRSIKFYPDKNANPSTRYQGNDFPVFRLGDVILMKAEAILRGAAPTAVKGELQTAVVLVNKIRKRVNADEVTAITLDELLDERARELAWEGWRRNDLIRFGKFESAWGFKTNSETYRRIYPIPATEVVLSNGALDQNDGYE